MPTATESPARLLPREWERWQTRALVGRYYDPTTGQFLSVDPDVDTTGMPYAYANGDPVDIGDPDGADAGGQTISPGTLAGSGLLIAIALAGHNCIQSGACGNTSQVEKKLWDAISQALSHPQDKLPGIGTNNPYIPKPRKGKQPEVVPNPQGPGYLDQNDDVWQWDAQEGHWDVQPKGARGPGKHRRITPGGEAL